MFSSDIPKSTDENGAVLIDRDARHFSKILNFLRNGMGPVLETERDVKELKLEAEFYLISELMEYCDNYKTLEKSKQKVMVYRSNGKWGFEYRAKISNLPQSNHYLANY